MDLSKQGLMKIHNEVYLRDLERVRADAMQMGLNRSREGFWTWMVKKSVMKAHRINGVSVVVHEDS
jgi:hypothetical protein